MSNKIDKMGEIFYDSPSGGKRKDKSVGLSGYFVMEKFNDVLLTIFKMFFIPLVAALIISIIIGGGFIPFYILSFIVVFVFYVISAVKKYNEMRI